MLVSFLDRPGEPIMAPQIMALELGVSCGPQAEGASRLCSLWVGARTACGRVLRVYSSKHVRDQEEQPGHCCLQDEEIINALT